MSSLPGNVTVCGVKGHFAYTRLLPGDPDGVMDQVPVEGLVVTITPGPTFIKDATATPPTSFLPDPLVMTTDALGDLRDVDGNSIGYVLGSDNPNLNPTGWTYTIAFTGVGAPRMRAFSLPLLGGDVVDLALVIPAPSSLGVGASVAEAAAAAAAAAASAAAASAAVASAAVYPATTVITYNVDNTVATVTENGVLTSYTYSGGNVATDSRGGVTRTYTYDGSGNLTGIAA